jgi:hypothetical protein
MIFIRVDLPAVGADDPDLGVGIELQVDVVEDGLVAREGLGQALHYKAVLGGHCGAVSFECWELPAS